MTANCPHCGKPGEVDGRFSQASPSDDGVFAAAYAAGCEHCGVIGPEASTPEDAAHLWASWCIRAAGLAWSRTPPASPGFWFWRPVGQADAAKWTVVRLVLLSDGRLSADGLRWLDDFSMWEWAGPIALPTT